MPRSPFNETANIASDDWMLGSIPSSCDWRWCVSWFLGIVCYSVHPCCMRPGSALVQGKWNFPFSWSMLLRSCSMPDLTVRSSRGWLKFCWVGIRPARCRDTAKCSVLTIAIFKDLTSFMCIETGVQIPFPTGQDSRTVMLLTMSLSSRGQTWSRPRKKWQIHSLNRRGGGPVEALVVPSYAALLRRKISSWVGFCHPLCDALGCHLRCDRDQLLIHF